MLTAWVGPEGVRKGDRFETWSLGENLGGPTQIPLWGIASSWCPNSPELRTPRDLEALKDTFLPAEPSGAAGGSVVSRTDAEAARPRALAPAVHTTSASSTPLGALPPWHLLPGS